MPLFKKKKKAKKNEFSNVYMPARKSSNATITTKRRKTRNSKGKIVKRTKHKFNPEKFKKGFTLVLFILFILGLFYLSIIFVVNLRKQASPDVITENVVGLDDIPAFPNSQFIFKDDMENTSVSTFISSGNSAYKIPKDKNINDVYEFYSQQLPERGWTFVLSSPMASDTMKSGEYWTKENTGLRIYTKFNDVWFETITKQQAESGLADKVKEEIERDLLLASEDAQDLLPDFPWLLKVPREYVISYSVAPYNNMRTLEMKKVGAKDIFFLTPIDKYNGGGLDYYLDSYIKYIKEEKEDLCGIKKTTIAYTPYSSAIRGEISCNEGLHDVAVFVHPNTGVVYVFDCNQIDSLYFDEVLTNLKPQESTRY